MFILAGVGAQVFVEAASTRGAWVLPNILIAEIPVSFVFNNFLGSFGRLYSLTFILGSIGGAVIDDSFRRI